MKKAIFLFVFFLPALSSQLFAQTMGRPQSANIAKTFLEQCAVTDDESRFGQTAQPAPNAAQPQHRSSNYAFEEKYVYDLGDYWCEHLLPGDFNNDGLKDIMLMATTTPDTAPPYHYLCKIVFLKNEGLWEFSEHLIATYSSYGYLVTGGDFNNDGWLDIADMAAGKTHIRLNQQNGGFYQTWSGGDGYSCLETADLNNDGHLDFLTGIQKTGTGGQAKSYLNTNAGWNFNFSWESEFYGSTYGTIHDLCPIDYNSDGAIDFVCTEIYDGLLMAFKGDGSGANFENVWQKDFGINNRVFALTTGNINGDQAPDFAAYVGWGGVYTYVSGANDIFTEHWVSPFLADGGYGLDLMDFNQDGFDDLFVGTFWAGKLLIFENQNGTSFNLAWSDTLEGPGYTGKALFFDSDNRPDLIVGEENKIRIWTQTPPVSVKNAPDNTITWHKCTPTPFVESTQISYHLTKNCEVQIKILDLTGREVETLTNETQGEGVHEITFHPKHLVPGIYIYVIEMRDKPYTSTTSRVFGKICYQGEN